MSKLTYFDLGVFCAKLREHYERGEPKVYKGNSFSVWRTLAKMNRGELGRVGSLTGNHDVPSEMYREIIDEEWAEEMQHQVESIRQEYLNKQNV